MMNEKICDLCRYCTHEPNYNEFMCHNEDSPRYGEIINDKNAKSSGCDDFDCGRKVEDISLEEALWTHTIGDNVVGAYYVAKIPQRDDKYAHVTLVFKTNKELMDWKETHARLFKEFMDLHDGGGKL